MWSKLLTTATGYANEAKEFVAIAAVSSSTLIATYLSSPIVVSVLCAIGIIAVGVITYRFFKKTTVVALSEDVTEATAA